MYKIIANFISIKKIIQNKISIKAHLKKTLNSLSCQVVILVKIQIITLVALRLASTIIV
jgi:hypothetical protein